MNKKAAICFHGAVSKIGNRFDVPGSLYNDNQYINYTACYNSTIKHIVEANKNYNFDFFIHSWNFDLSKDLNNLYNPKSYSYEHNSIYENDIKTKITNNSDYGGVSRAISILKSIELLEQYNKKYDAIIIYRLDILLYKDINLDSYNLENIYSNGNINADFHFIMNYDNAICFKNLYHSIDNGNKHKYHWWIYNFIVNYLHKPLVADQVYPGKNQEVLRKLATTISDHNLDINNFLQYGLTKEEINTYRDIYK